MRSGPPTGAEEEQSLEAPEPIDIRDPNHKQIEPAALVLSHGDYAGDIGQVTNITDPEYNEEGELVTPQILVLFPDYEEPVSFDTSHKGGGDRETGDGEPDWFLCEELEVTDSDRWRATEVEAYGQQERPMSEPASEETINVSRELIDWAASVLENHRSTVAPRLRAALDSPSSPHVEQKRYTIYICPECGQQLRAAENACVGAGDTAHEFADAVPLEVVPADSPSSQGLTERLRDEVLEAWHAGAFGERSHLDCLHMTEEEYSAWVERRPTSSTPEEKNSTWTRWLTEEDRERLRKIAYGLETGYFRDDAPAVLAYALQAADTLRKLAEGKPSEDQVSRRAIESPDFVAAFNGALPGCIRHSTVDTIFALRSAIGAVQPSTPSDQGAER